MIPGRTSMKVLTSQLGRPGRVGLSGRPRKYWSRVSVVRTCHKPRHLIAISDEGSRNGRRRGKKERSTYIVDQIPRVTPSSQQLPTPVALGVEVRRLRDGEDEGDCQERYPVVVRPCHHFDSAGAEEEAKGQAESEEEGVQAWISAENRDETNGREAR